LIDQIGKQGGEIVANPSVPGCVVVAGSKRTLVLKNIIDKGEQDVIDFSYIIDCITVGEKLSFKPYYYISMSPTTRHIMTSQYDSFGDSYTEDTTTVELQKIFRCLPDVRQQLIKKIQLKTAPPIMTKPIVIRGTKRKTPGNIPPIPITNEAEDKYQAAEEERILSDWQTITTIKSWKKLLPLYYHPEEQSIILHKTGNIFYSPHITIYVDMFSDLGQCILQSSSSSTDTIPLITPERELNRLTLDPLLSRYEQEFLSCAYYRLLSRGAQVTTHLSTAVSHILLLSPMTMSCFSIRFTRLQVTYSSLAYDFNNEMILMNVLGSIEIIGIQY